MSPSNPRIIVCDEKNIIYNIVKTSLELLGRTPRLIHTHTASDALAELSLSTADLFIISQTLRETEAADLALIAKRELASLPILIIGEETDPVLQEDAVTFQYVRRPFLPETFLRALRIALDGPEAVPTSSASDEALMIPVPILDKEKLRGGMFNLMREVQAMAAVMADRHGKVVMYEGAAGYIDRDLLAGALAASSAGLIKMLPIIGDQPRVLQYFNGGKNDLYVLNIGLHHFLMLIYEGNAPSTTLGTVRRIGTSIVNEMIAIITPDVAFGLKMPPTPEPEPPRKSRKTATREMPVVQPQQSTGQNQRNAPPERDRGNDRGNDRSDRGRDSRRNAPAPEPEPIRLAPRPPVPEAEAIPNFDPNLFDNIEGVDLSMADAMFDPTLNDFGGLGDKISFDDALLQGIIGDIQE